MSKKSAKKTKPQTRPKRQRKQRNVQDYIEPLYMNGLTGRMLRMPAPEGRKREFLFIYGHHSTIERWWGVIQDINQYGAITVPDLPGFGGMDSLYKIGQKPTIDALADYLAAFVKLRYKRRRVTIIGLSYGFVVVTRMLQRYPDMAKKVDVLFSFVGFASHEEFTFSKPRLLFYRHGARFFSFRLSALAFRGVALHPWVLRAIYSRLHNAKEKFNGTDAEQHQALMDFEVHLWHANDLRTYMFTSAEFLRLDNCRHRVDLPLWHVNVKADRYFDNNIVEQHLKVIFPEVHIVPSKMDQHAPSVVATMEESAPIIPNKLRRFMSKND